MSFPRYPKYKASGVEWLGEVPQHWVVWKLAHAFALIASGTTPKVVRDQFKANATRVLRQEPDPLTNENVWTRGGDCEVVDGEDNLARVVEYILEAQDRMDRGK